jgi:non-lysosomal glucosylceramidase
MQNIRTFDASAVAAAFPLGGVGTGNVSLGARGELRDWEIMNRPNKGSKLPNTFFALRIKGSGEPITRVLEGAVQPPHILSHGYHPSTGVGLPRFAKSTMRGEYPMVWIDLEDEELPVRVQLEAYTPLVPLNPEDSGIPCAIFTYHVMNTSAESLTVTLAGSLTNPTGLNAPDVFGNLTNGEGLRVNRYREENDLRGLFLDIEDIDAASLKYGNLSLTTTHKQTTVKPAWLRAGWWDYVREFWDDLHEDGLLTDLGYEPANKNWDTGSLGLLDTIPEGETRTFRFILTWYYPNRVNSWDAKSTSIIRNHYATRFDDSWAVARYTLEHFDRLDKSTRDFHNALFSTTLPPAIIDAVSANIVPVRSNTCFWLEDGRFFGWEGCFDTDGCCAGSCTHVWSYAYSAAFLFPSLEREMRRIEFTVETEDDGYMFFRTFQTFGENFKWTWGDQKAEAAVDGQMGSILRAYREYQLSGDKDWLAQMWPGIKRSIDYASMHWDTDNDHVLDGKQHNTYDIEFYGHNPLCGIYYLAALRAVEEMARIFGETALADRCRAAFQQASPKLDQLLWNGEFYVQRLDDVDAYKYQHGLGILADQLLGQLHASILGLGDLLPAGHVKQAVKSIYDYNFRRGFKNHVNAQRTYVLNDESGLLMCTWPNGGEPRYPFPYSDEVWTGVEYQVAAHLIYEGWLHEALEIVTAARARHDGVRRNPWNEVECGHHYARTMSSWMLLLALTGTHTDLGRGELRFEPVWEASTDSEAFSTFWSTGRAWGTFTQPKDAAPSIHVLGGDLNGVKIYANGQEIKAE